MYDGLFHIPAFKTRISESPVDRFVYMTEATTDAVTATVDLQIPVPFQEDAVVSGLVLKRFTVGEVNPGEVTISISDGDAAAFGLSELVDVLLIGRASSLD